VVHHLEATRKVDEKTIGLPISSVKATFHLGLVQFAALGSFTGLQQPAENSTLPDVNEHQIQPFPFIRATAKEIARAFEILTDALIVIT